MTDNERFVRAVVPTADLAECFALRSVTGIDAMHHFRVYVKRELGSRQLGIGLTAAAAWADAATLLK